MNTGISRRQFAKREKCSEAAIRKALQQGRLVAYDDNTIDPGLVGTPWRDGVKRKANGGSADDMSFAEALRIKTMYLARLRRLEYEIKSNKLVDAFAVESEVSDLAREHRDALQNWPARVGPLIAAEFQIDPIKLQISLDRHVRQFLVERSTSEPRLKQAGGLRAKQAGA